jgi:hypothetical protein
MTVAVVVVVVGVAILLVDSLLQETGAKKGRLASEFLSRSFSHHAHLVSCKGRSFGDLLIWKLPCGNES